MRIRLITACAVVMAKSLAAASFEITVSNDLATARPAETIVVPFAQVQKRLPALKFEQLVVRDATGEKIPYQVTSFVQTHSGPAHYDELIFQHDFAAGEKSATFSVETSDAPVPPFVSRVYARAVPERFDDFAWENDKLAHRVYGPGLEKASAGKDRMTSSGIDVWCKRVPYLVLDRFYRKGHDGLHTDTGEGLDFYSVGTSRGAGGTGVWDGKTLHVSDNYASATVLANGPLRAVFVLKYEAFDGGNGVRVTETKRFVVDAGDAFETVDSTFDFTPPAGGDGTITVAVGLGLHPREADVSVKTDETSSAISVWEKYADPAHGQLGTAIILAPGTARAGLVKAEREALILAKVKPGGSIRYRVGSAWSEAGEIRDDAAWRRAVADAAGRYHSSVKIELSPGR